MRLHYSPTSPYVRKVMLVLIETGQRDAVDLVPAAGTPLDSAGMPLDQNPLGKIPVLERDDGPALYDSRVICQYLNARAGAALYPPAPRLWETLTIEATAEGILDAAIAVVYETRLRPPEGVSPALLDGFWAKITRAVAALETHWGPHLAQAPDMAHLAVATALDYVDFRVGDRDWRAAAPRLADWHRQISARPSLQQTLPRA